MQCPTCGQEIKDNGSSAKLKGLHVAIDAGHGWGDLSQFDTGAIGNNVTEYELNLLTATIVKTLLEAQGAMVSVFNYPKSDTRRLTLRQKGKRAGIVGANLFVSIHHNAFNGDAQGTETLVHPEATASDLKFATLMQNALVKELLMTDRGVKRQQLGILAGVPDSIPAILTEGFFIDSKDFRGKIPNEVSERYARGVAAGIEQMWAIISGG